MKELLNQMKDLGKVLTKDEQRKIRGGEVCTLRCDQDGGASYEVPSCAREYAQEICESLDNAVCVC